MRLIRDITVSCRAASFEVFSYLMNTQHLKCLQRCAHKHFS